MDTYFVYKVTFLTTENDLQKTAIDMINKYLPGQLIVNTSMALSKIFAEGGYIGNELEVESETKFTDIELGIAVMMSNGDLGSSIIDKIEGIGENIIGYQDDIYTDLTDFSW